MSLFSDYFSREALEVSRSRVVGYLQAAGLVVSNWITGSVPDQIKEGMTNAVNASAALVSQLVRGRASLDTATDPGDPDPYDAGNVALTPRRGFLSEYGEGVFGTPRLEESFAAGFVTIANGGGSAVTIAPEQVTFSRDTADTTTGLAPTYKNTADATIYTNPNGTATIAAGASLTIPIVAEERGVGSNAGASHIQLTTSLGSGVTGTNAAAVLASTREDADAYRARCRTAAALLSLQGPEDAYRVIALAAQKDEDGNVFFLPPWGDGTTAIGVDSDGTFQIFPNARGTSLGVNRVYVDADSTNGAVGLWFATASGDPGPSVLADLTLLLDALYQPQNNVVTYNRANPVTVNIVGTLKARSGSGVTSAVVEAAADAALALAFPTWDIGGFDQTAGAGVIYQKELEATANGAHPRIYLATVATPSSNPALAKGDVAVLGTTSWTTTVA